MSAKQDILNRIRAGVRNRYDMPALDDIAAVTYPDPLAQFIKMSEAVGGKVIEPSAGEDLNALVRRLFPDAREIASNLPEITTATRNPDTAGSAQALDCTDVGIIRGEFGVAENGCICVRRRNRADTG